MQAILAFLIVISVVIVFHELGHYWVARLFGTKIDAFSIGFGPKLLGWIDRAGTQWKLCALPLGGYVKFHGDATAASVPDKDRLDELRRVAAAEGVDPKSILHFKPIYQRALIVFAGPFANFVLALVLLTAFLIFVGEPTYPVKVLQVLPDTPAAAAGLKPGDQILDVDGWRVYRIDDVANHIRLLADRPVDLTIERAGETLQVKLEPEKRVVTLEEGGHQSKALGGQIGIEMAEDRAAVVTYHHPLVQAAGRGVEIILVNTQTTFWYLKNVITGHSKPDMLGGPLRIAQISGEVAQTGWVNLVAFIALISVSVGLVNLFPIPVLDGGHLLFYAIEAIQGRPLSHRVQEIGFRIGLALLAALFLFVTWNDIIYLLPGVSSKAGAP